MNFTRDVFVLAFVLALIGCRGGSGPADDPNEPPPPARSPTIKGRVVLNGKADHSGTSISLDGRPVTRTDAEGNYSVAEVSEGVHVVSIASSGYSAVSHDIEKRAGDFLMPDITLIPTDGATALRAPLPVSSGIATVWNFNHADDRLAADGGPARLYYRDPARTGWGPKSTAFARASAFGLPPIDGDDPYVMQVPATGPGQGYSIVHNSLPNGVFGWDGYVSNYTVVMDVLWPVGAAGGYRSLLQTAVGNADDGDLFAVASADEVNIGVGSVYRGEIPADSWHRIAITVQCAHGTGGTGQLSVYVDGRLARGGNTPDTDGRCRWALEPSFHLFTDDDGETATTYVSSIMYVDRYLSAAEIETLGGPNAAGADRPGSAAPPLAAASRGVMNVAHRGQGADAPEDTVAALRSVFEAGVRYAEADVRFTSDGVAVLMHDATVDRTTNGIGSLSAMTLAQVRQLDAGSWLDPKFADVKVPTLVEALAVAKEYGAKLLLDVKVPGKAAAVKAALDAAGVDVDAVWVEQGSSDPEVRDQAARDFQEHMPGVGVLWMVVPDSAEEYERLKSENGVVGFDMDIEQLSEEFIADAHGHGLDVIAYTAMDPETMRELIALGVDGMETDYSLVLQSIMP